MTIGMRLLLLTWVILSATACAELPTRAGDRGDIGAAVPKPASPPPTKAIDLSPFTPKIQYPPGYYQGPLFDTHLHQSFLLPGSRPIQITPESWLNLMDTYGIGAVLAFVSLTPQVMVAAAGQQQVGGSPGQPGGGMEECIRRVLGRTPPPPPSQEEMQRIRQECGGQPGAMIGGPGQMPGQPGQAQRQQGQMPGRPGQAPTEASRPTAQGQQAFLASLDSLLAPLHGRVVPLLFPKGQSGAGGADPSLAGWEEFVAGDFTRDFLRPLLVQGRFHGFGEIAFRQPQLTALSPSDAQLQVAYPFVAAMNGVVMWHPRENMTPEDFTVIGDYPRITFLFHGLEYNLDSLIVPLLQRYPNVYFTLDVAPMASFKGRTLFYGNGRGVFGDEKTTPDTLAKIEQLGGMQAIAQAVWERFGWLIQAYPDRVMWGTDIAAPHFWQEEGYIGVMVEWSRLFISYLPREVQDAYAYKNAQRVFGHLLSPTLSSTPTGTP